MSNRDPFMNPTPRSNFTSNILSLAKCALLASFTVFMLYMPLGDPERECESCQSYEISQPEPTITCALCNWYQFMVWVGERTVATILMLKCMLYEALYEFKLTLYSLLSKYDNQDFCDICLRKVVKSREKKPCGCWYSGFCENAK